MNRRPTNCRIKVNYFFLSLNFLKFLTHYLKSIEDWIGHEESYKHPVARASWAILQDFHHDPAVVEYPPEAIAVAAIEMAMKVYGTQVRLCSEEGKNSWQMVSNFPLTRAYCLI